jgi:signal peptidase I
MRDGKFYNEGKEITSYQFKDNYYFMMGDNRHNSLDSRFWGLVPDDHIVGTSFIVLGSLNPDKTGLSKIRNRFFYFPK